MWMWIALAVLAVWVVLLQLMIWELASRIKHAVDKAGRAAMAHGATKVRSTSDVAAEIEKSLQRFATALQSRE